MALDPHVIVPAHGAEVQARIYNLPRNGSILIDGVPAVVGSLFNMSHIYEGRIQYKHTKEMLTYSPLVTDFFTFSFVGPDGLRIPRPASRNPCLPGVPYVPSAAGLYRFNVQTITVPLPSRIAPLTLKYVNVIENGEMTLTDQDLRYAVKLDKYDTYLTNPPIDPVYPAAGWERFPVEYEFTGAYPYYNYSNFELKGSLKLNGVPMVAGQTFTNEDIRLGRIKAYGFFKGYGIVRVAFNVRIKGTGKFVRSGLLMRVVPLATPNISGVISMLNCSDWAPINPLVWRVTSPGSEPKNLRITIDAATLDPRVQINPMNFTYQDVIDQKVKIRHVCATAPNPNVLSIYNIRVNLTVCNEFDKCTINRYATLAIKPWPYPSISYGTTGKPRGGTYPVYGTDTINVTPRLSATAEGSTPDQITWVFDQAATFAFHKIPQVWFFNRTTFTQADINAGLITVTNRPSGSSTHDHMTFTVSTQHGRSKSIQIGLVALN